jgi:FkbM family methyltransferase
LAPSDLMGAFVREVYQRVHPRCKAGPPIAPGDSSASSRARGRTLSHSLARRKIPQVKDHNDDWRDFAKDKGSQAATVRTERTTGSTWSNMIKTQVHRALNALGWQALRRADGSLEVRPLIRMGRDPLHDIKHILGSGVRTVFDVGANDGQTVRRFARTFPHADLYSFEPDPATFQRLVAAAGGLPKTQLFNLALGREAGEASLFRFAFDETNSLLRKAAGAESYVADAGFLRETGTIPVKVSTIDAVCEASGISRIDLLKIDTQGYEVEVLRGAERMLRSAVVPLVYAEVCFVACYENQPLFQDVYAFLYERGFRLVGLYESGFLTRYYHVGGNALFVHQSFGEAKPLTDRLTIGPLRICW